MRLKDIYETISPIIVKPHSGAIHIGLSKRFMIFQLMNKLIKAVEEDPFFNFIAVLKSYKILGRFLHGTLHEFHRDRNKLYFKNFFLDRDLWEQIKQDLEWLYPKYKHIRMTITKRGMVIYDNYQKNSFNVLLLTVHSGTWVPRIIDKKLSVSKTYRRRQEDIDTHKIYSNLVLEKSGIWIDNKQSRFVVDFNRKLSKAIYSDNSEEWLDVVWKEELTKKESDVILDSYKEFYFSLARLLDSFRFNIIFDAHSMKDKPGRADISFGTNEIPNFYMPIVRSMKSKLISIGYNNVMFNKPYGGGYILEFLSCKFPDVFIFSMEINKKLYMKKLCTLKRKMKNISKDLEKIFDIEVE